MLSTYVRVLEVIQEIGGAGDDVTTGKVAKSCNMTYHKAKVVLKDLRDFGMVYTHLRHHRPNVTKMTYDISVVGSSWVHLMNLSRMKGL